MADFSPSDFHRDVFLTGLLVGYRPRNMIADMIFPVMPVPKESNVFAKIDKGHWFRIPETNRAVGTKAQTVRYTVSSDTYRVKNYELITAVPFEVLDNEDPPHNTLQRNGEFLVDQLMLDFEQRVCNTVVTGCGSSQTLSGLAAWNDYANSDPLTNLETAREAIRSTTGFTPNTAIIGEKAWLKMRRHPDIVRAIYPGAGVGGTASTAQFADLIGVGRVLIGSTIKNVGADGAADAFTDVWSTHCILAYVEPNPGIMTATLGLAFRWGGTNIGNNGPGAFQIERRRDTEVKVEELRTGYYQDEKIVASELGFRIDTGITS